MAQAGKGKLNYRCPSCFMRDIDMDMFSLTIFIKKIWLISRSCSFTTVCAASSEAPKKMSFRKMKWQDSVMALCMSVTANSILIDNGC